MIFSYPDRLIFLTIYCASLKSVYLEKKIPNDTIIVRNYSTSILKLRLLQSLSVVNINNLVKIFIRKGTLDFISSQWSAAKKYMTKVMSQYTKSLQQLSNKK